MSKTVYKDPDAVLDYIFDWAPATNGRNSRLEDWLDVANGETISSHSVSADTGITVDSDSRIDSDTAVVVWLSGGAEHARYKVTCQITTNQGRTDERTFEVIMKER